MPGVALKNVAILPFTLAGIDVICVAVRTTSQKTNARLLCRSLCFCSFFAPITNSKHDYYIFRTYHYIYNNM